MIKPRDRKTMPRLGVRNPRKTDILRFMKSFEPYALAESYVIDYRTGKVNKSQNPDAYKVSNLIWNGEDVFNFEYNDMELSPEFCARVLELMLTLPDVCEVKSTQIRCR